jgi:putative intracellular protease/amidase
MSLAPLARKFVISIAIFGTLVLVFSLALPTLLHRAGLHPVYEGPSVSLPGKRALIITTSHAVLSRPGEKTGKATGVFASELTHPYYTFVDGGMSVDVASIVGGEIPIDPMSFRYMLRSPEDERFLQDSIAQAKVQHSIAIADVDMSDYDIVFLSGGWGAAYDLAQSELLATKVEEAYEGDRAAILGGVCHGVLGLARARDREGRVLVAGRRMTGVTDKQISELGIEFTPLHPESVLREAGALFEAQTRFRDFLATHVVVDAEKRFVTGQNQNSGLATAHRMMDLLSKRDSAGKPAPESRNQTTEEHRL